MTIIDGLGIDPSVLTGAGQRVSPYMEAQLRRVAANYKLTPATLAHRLNPLWIPAPHLMYISAQIATAIVRGSARIVISVPPRHGKSELVTKYTTTWVLEHFPWMNVILASYGAELSVDFGRKVRDIIADNQDKLSVRLRKDFGRVNNWVTQQDGGMMSVGVNGPITGRGANVLLIDDYVKDIREANSKTIRESTWDWFVTTAFTRVEPGGSCIIIATRWHWDDLIGRILRRNPGGRWTEIRIPALAEEGDILGRHVGQALFPERYDLNYLQERLETLGTFFFNALYQQRPENENARLTSRNWLMPPVTELPPFSRMQFFRVWDLAATEGGGDYTVGTLCAYYEENDTFYILDVLRRQSSPGQVEALVYRTAVDDGHNCRVIIEQEPGSSGKSLVEHFINNVLKDFQTEAYPSGNSGSKIEKAQPFLAAAESGKVKLYKGHWNETFLDEFQDFPGGEHDDQVDTAAVGFIKVRGKKALTASWGRSKRSEASAAIRLRDTNTNRIARDLAKQYGLDPLAEARIKTEQRNARASGDPGAPSSSGIIWGRRSGSGSGSRSRR
jgi:predicted phage terminase large subunit-like protein